jgi:ABC-type sugar transport system substrate-binding protein
MDKPKKKRLLLAALLAVLVGLCAVAVAAHPNCNAKPEPKGTP